MSSKPVKSIDVVVPSFRLQDGPLEAILAMRCPDGAALRFIVVADNPVAALPAVLAARADDPSVLVIRNATNLGASESRNRGVAVSCAEWVLFLDDDVVPDPGLLVVYAEAIARESGGPGFFGITEYPAGSTAFEKGVLASEILTFFSIANWYVEMPWATTSNVLVRGDRIRAHRFSNVFPRSGGGEDIDLFLRLTGEAGANLRAVPGAVVRHAFWAGNRRNYRRFFRWAYGDSKLHALHPLHVYRAAPNAVELAVALPPFAIMAAIAFGSPALVVAPFVGVLLSEWLGETVRLLARRAWRDALRGHEVAAIRTANDLGRFVSLVVDQKQWRRVGERFDHFCDGRHIAHQKAWAAGKCMLTLVIVALLCLLSW